MRNRCPCHRPAVGYLLLGLALSASRLDRLLDAGSVEVPAELGTEPGRTDAWAARHLARAAAMPAKAMA